ncbi:hypothetical protein BH10PSE1_BH10PSE1_16790 [soil metagenome]
MSDHNEDEPTAADSVADDIPGETSVQKALRLKQARLDARPQPPRGGRFQREQSARIASGQSRPWMKK